MQKHGYEIALVANGLSERCALSMEAAFIRMYGRDQLCNLTDGGDVGPLGMRQSENMRRKQSERMKGNKHSVGRKLSDDHKAKISAGGKGRVVSDATREKLRGRVASDATRAKMSAALKGIERSDEWRRRLSEAGKSRAPMSQQTKDRLSASLKGLLVGVKNPSYGIPKTPEQKARLRAAMLGRKFKPESIAARSGENHPRYDATVHAMTHSDGRVASGTRRELTLALGLRKNVFTSLLNGSKKTTAGWRLTK